MLILSLTGKRNVPRKEDKQRKLEPWTWLRLEARQVVVDIANSVERMKLVEEAASKN